MRVLDRWLGIPLCFGATLLRRIATTLRLARSGAAPVRPQRVLCVLLSESGSMILADPAIRVLAEPSGSISYFLTFAHNRPALAISGTIAENRIFSLRTDNLLVLTVDVLRWRRQMRVLGIDTVVDLELFSRLSAILCLSSGARRRIGFHDIRNSARGCYRGDLYTHRISYDPALHISHNYLALAGALRDSTADQATLPQPPRRSLQPDEIEAACALLAHALPQEGRKRLLLLNPNASEFLPQRRWPATHFVALACRLLERHTDLGILLIGSADDAPTTAEIAASVADPRCADIAGRLALPQLPALFSLADAMVSNDSGPAHFAAVTDLPVVVLFGPETPARYRPLGNATALTAGLPCSPCVGVENQRHTRCRDNRCMRAISVESVLATVEALLVQRPAAPRNVFPLHPPAEPAPGLRQVRA